MAVTAKLYSNAINEIKTGGIPDLTDAGTAIKVALMYQNSVPENFAFDQTDVDWSDVSAFECTDSDYTAGGIALTNKTVTTTGRVTKFSTSNDPNKTTFTSSGDITATHAVIYLATGVDATSFLIGCVNFDGTKTSSAGEFSITWDADGIFDITVDA